MSAGQSTSSTRNAAKVAAIALLSGLIFAAGLALGGMLDPRKVQGFLDVGGIGAGRWDPSLAFVMGGALAVSFAAFATSKRARKTWTGLPLTLPERREIDVRLIGGSALFGIGWGVSGYCPGPAIASLFTGGTDAAWFVAAMLIGMTIAKNVRTSNA